MQLPAKVRYSVVCQCGGLGWVPAALAPSPVRGHDDEHREAAS